MHKMEHVVHLSDTDTTGQVYYSKPLEWLEWCRVDWFTRKFGNFMKFVENTGITYFPSKANVEYKKPIFFGDKLTIEMLPKEVRKISFLLDYTIKRGEEVVLKSEINMVSFDVKNKTFARLNDEMLKTLSEM